MEPIEIQRSPRELWGFVIVGVILLTIMGWLPFWVSPQPHPDDPAWLAGTLIWGVALAFAGLSVIVISSSLKQLASEQAPFVADSEGFWDRRLGVGKIMWSQVDEVRLVSSGWGSQVLVKLLHPEDVTKHLTFHKRVTMKLSRHMTSADLSIAASGLAISGEELYRLIGTGITSFCHQAV